MLPVLDDWLARTLYSLFVDVKVLLLCLGPVLPVVAWLIYRAVRRGWQDNTIRAGLSTREPELGRADETAWSRERLRRFGLHRHRRHHHHAV